MKSILFILLMHLIFIFGCGSDGDIHDHSYPTIAITQWTREMEIFMEYETPVAGDEIKFIIHLTTLNDFKAVQEGKIVLRFEDKSGPVKTLETDSLLRQGIFTPLALFENAGEFQFSVDYSGQGINQHFNIGKFTVYPDDHALPVAEEAVVDEIIFLKEQQWKLDFATEIAMKRPVKKAVRAVGEVVPRPESFVEIVSPVEGIVSTHTSSLVKTGQMVKQGQSLVVLLPPLSTQNSWAEIYLNYEQARAEFERAQRLKDRQAVSERDYQTARRNFEIHQAGFSGYFGSQNSSSTLFFDKKTQRFTLTTPINGTVNDVSVLPGQKVDRHQRICSIIDPDKVWLRFDLSLSQAERLSDITGATIRIPSIREEVHLPADQIKFISKGGVVDLVKHTIPIWLETSSNNRLFIGQHFVGILYSGAAQELITVPKSSIFDDNAQQIVFIHTSGESFEKRVVRTGPSHYGYVSITEGLSGGERVVSRGGYQVKLASITEEIGHGHSH